MYVIYYGFSFIFLAKTSFTTVGFSFTDSVNVGWKNYRLLMADPVFIRSILNNLLFAAIAITVGITIAFLIAVALSSGVRPKRLFYMVFLLPVLMPVSLVATLFGSMLQQQYGELNVTLRTMGLGFLAQPWLTQEFLAYGVVAVIFCYLMGLPIMYYTADLSALPTEPLEAALIDGAGAFRIMRSIIYPMMKSTRRTIILALLLGSFRALEVVLFSTQGNPGQTTEIVGTYLYGFETSAGTAIGYVSAASIIVLLIALVISIVQMLFLRKGGRSSQ